MGCHEIMDDSGKYFGHMCLPNIYKYDGYTFEDHYYLGPMLVYTRTFEPRDRQPGPRSRFWSVYENFSNFSPIERKKYLVYG